MRDANERAEEVIAQIELAQDRLHAKWWEIAAWLVDAKGEDAAKLTPDARIVYASHIRALTDRWDDPNLLQEVGKPQNATTELHRLLSEYYDLTEVLEKLHGELDELETP